MQFQPSSFVSEALLGGVRVNASAPAVVVSALLGSAPVQDWEAWRRLGPVGLDAEAPPGHVSGHAARFTRDFGDSVVRCVPDGDAVAEVLAGHRPPVVARAPSALAFAFAQQWARLGCLATHAALVQLDGVGVLALGARGRGKSVLAASAVRAGGAIVSDDHLLLGQRDGACLGERIRQFVSVRRSWAVDTLLAGTRDDWNLGRSGNRAYLEIPSGDPRFPAHARVDRLWVLARPASARGALSSSSRLDQASAYATLVAAGQPLLLGAAFPRERERLQVLMRRLATLPAARVETGEDIVREPRRAWNVLLRATA